MRRVVGNVAARVAGSVVAENTRPDFELAITRGDKTPLPPAISITYPPPSTIELQTTENWRMVRAFTTHPPLVRIHPPAFDVAECCEVPSDWSSLSRAATRDL